MKKPKLSVVSATYNRVVIMRMMLDSVFAQSRVPDEVVVSDDNSPDGSGRMLDAYARTQPKLKVIHQPKNSGGVKNWNHAVNGASGDIIAWCSDDDRLAPGHLETSLDYLTRHADVDMVHSGFINAWQDESGVVTEAASELYSSEPFSIQGAGIVGYMMGHYSWPFHPSTLVFRRRLWENVGEFDPRYELADTDWFIRAVIRHKVAYLPRYGAINRRHMENWSLRTGAVKMHDEVNQAMTEALPTIPVSAASRALHALRWNSFHHYRMARLYLARSRAGRLDVAQDIARSMSRSSGLSQSVISEKSVASVAGTVSRCIRKVQELFPAGVRRYDERAKWEPQ